MAARAAAAVDSHSESDIRQLRGLAVQEDDDAFLPLRPEELGPSVPRRLTGLRGLVDCATESVTSSGLASTKSLNVTPRATGYGRYLMLGGASAWFGLDYERWATLRDTPLWLELKGFENGWHRAKYFGEIRGSLDALRQRSSTMAPVCICRLICPLASRTAQCLTRWLDSWRRLRDRSDPPRLRLPKRDAPGPLECGLAPSLSIRSFRC